MPWDFFGDTSFMDFSAAQAQHEMAKIQQGESASDEVVSLTLPAQPTSPQAARAWVRQSCPDLDDSVLSDVELIASELVSNAVRHGAPAIELRLRRAPFAVDVAVLDHGEGMPPSTVDKAQLNALSGRGLFLVENLSNQWGVQPLEDGTGKTVWASLSR